MRRSKVSRLALPIREEIERAWREGRLTIDDLMAILHEKGVDFASDPDNGVSRSGLHRYLKSFGEAAERMRQGEQMAGAIVSKLGEPGSGNLRRMLTQLLSMVAMYQLRDLENTGAAMKPGDLMFLARAIKDIQLAFKADADAELRIKRDLADELKRKAAPALEKLDEAARAGGLSRDAADEIRRAITEIDI
jgi:hypothetical protein